MLRFVFIFGIILAALCGEALAQEPPLPSPSSSRPELDIPQIPIEPPTIAPAVSPAVPGAIPSVSPAPSTVDLSQFDALFKATPLGQVAEDLKLRVETRKLANQVVNDPQVIAAKKEIRGARTDLEKRRRYKIYYDAYYARMRALAATPEMKAQVDRLKAGKLALLAQPRVRPTPSPVPSPTTSPRP